ncbi:acetyl-CoA hydrolase/transferase C-terminal domain-containing protein [Sediminicoccus sp. KRV36]|uniref:acetyl-CoA hydrolase/transferase family protein n=1 Tax=Sediminicoccus sp. KRV36 TaxID=3133721 RepID=UPI0020102447|nr:acetyl-CoA hydrolase/transferase C-terminal domain-containing protein [Sediminicoccus rosea]UPY37138.1 butyryl-CoA:acetate CoA-transferase [Sediminicoccus rosea]
MIQRTAGRAARQMTPEEAAALVKSGDWLDYGATFNQPDAFDRALAARKAELHGVNIRNCLSMRPRAVLEADPGRAHFACYNWHFSGYDRKQHDAGLCHYIPCHLGEIPDYYRRFIERVDIAILKAAPMDAEGFFNLGPISLWHPAVIERATTLILEITPDMPAAVGTHVRVHHSQVDVVIEGDDTPMPELPNARATDVDRAVARLIAAEIEDGACLQVGIGGMPNAVTTLLLESGVKDLGVHTEMLNDGLIELYRAGRISGGRKAFDQGLLTYSFCLGSRASYDTLRGNDDFLCRPVDHTNLPDTIARNDRVVAINNTTQLDLQGQAASESAGHRHISGTGGQAQFVRGAYASKGGKSFICLASTYERHGQRRSRIVLDLTPGNVVTTPRSDQMFVVTEYGMVNLKGRSVPERAKAIIGLAHPDDREELARGARAKGLVPAHFL